MQKIGKGIGKTFVVLVVVASALKGFSYWSEYDAKKFCENLSESDAQDVVSTKARGENMFVDKHSEGVVTSIAVYANASPMFRTACIVEYNGQLQVSKYVSGYD